MATGKQPFRICEGKYFLSWREWPHRQSIQRAHCEQQHVLCKERGEQSQLVKEQKLAPVLRKQHKCFVSLGIRTTYRFKSIKSKSYASKPNTNLPQETITSQLISPLWPLKTSVWFGSHQAQCKAALQFLWYTVGCDTTLIHLLLRSMHCPFSELPEN